MLKNILVFIALIFAFLTGDPVKANERVTPSFKSRGLAHYIMGIKYELLGDSMAALKEYKEAARNDRETFAPHLRLGVAFAQRGDFGSAVGELSRALALDPKDMQAHYYLALVYSNLQNYRKAAEHYEAILKQLSLDEPKNAELFIYLGQLYFSQGEAGKAVEQYKKALALDPTNTDVLSSVAMYELDHGDRQQAFQLLKSCISQDPMQDACLNSLSYSYAEDNIKIEEALTLVQRALEIGPENAAYIDTLGWVYYRMGKYDDALRELKRAESLVKDPVIYGHIAEVYLKLNEPDLAKKYWELSLEVDPQQPDVQSKLGSFEFKSLKENN